MARKAAVQILSEEDVTPVELAPIDGVATAAPPKRTLADIAGDYMKELWEAEGEVTLRLEELDGEIDEKALAYKRVAIMLEAHAAAQDAQAAYLEEQAAKPRKRAAAIRKEIAELKNRLAGAMDQTGKTSIQTPIGKIYFREVESVSLPDGWSTSGEARLYPNFVKVTSEPKRALMMSAYKDAYKQALAMYKETFGDDVRSAQEAARVTALDRMPKGFCIRTERKLQGV